MSKGASLDHRCRMGQSYNNEHMKSHQSSEKCYSSSQLLASGINNLLNQNVIHHRKAKSSSSKHVLHVSCPMYMKGNVLYFGYLMYLTLMSCLLLCPNMSNFSYLYLAVDAVSD